MVKNTNDHMFFLSTTHLTKSSCGQRSRFSEEHLRLSVSDLHGRKYDICSFPLSLTSPSDHDYSYEYESGSRPRSPHVVSRAPQSLSQVMASTLDSQSCPLGSNSPSRNSSRLSSCLLYMKFPKVSFSSQHVKLQNPFDP